MKTAFKLWLMLFTVALLAAQCQASTPPPPTPTPIPAATPRVAIPRGDGSDLLDRLLDEGVIRVGVWVWPDPRYAPPVFRGYSNAATGGALNGFEVEIARLLADRMGLELELVPAYPPVLATGDWRGQWDIALGMLVPFDQPPERAIAPPVYSLPYGYIPPAILAPAGDESIQTLDDLSGRRVGVLEHSPFQRLLTSAGPPPTVNQQMLLPDIPPDIVLVPVDNLPKAIYELGSPAPGQPPAVDALFGPLPVFQQAAAAGLAVQVIDAAPNAPPLPIAVAVAPPEDLQVDRLVQVINDILTRLRRDGTLSEIYLRWYQQDYSGD